MRAKLVALIFAISASCQQSVSPAGDLVGSGRHVLFIGNSYLYYNDIPAITQALADSAGGDKLAIATVAGPDMALVDHLAEGTARKVIDRGGWEWVVLQQGPSSVEVNRDTLRLATKEFAAEITKQKGRAALFSAWPQANRRQDFPRAIESYQLAATDVNGLYIPVAAAWLAAWQRDPNLQLYDDGLHPSVRGAYLSAVVTYASLLQKTPRGLPSTLRLSSGQMISIDPKVAALLQDAAAEATGR